MRLEAAVRQGIPEDEAQLLVRTVRRTEDLRKMFESEEYARAQEMLKQALGISGNRKMLLTDYDLEFRAQSGEKGKAKESDMRLLTMFLDLLAAFGRDAVLKPDEGPKWYRNAVNNCMYTQEKCASLIRIANEQKDRVNKYNDLNLVMGQTCWRLEEWNHE